MKTVRLAVWLFLLFGLGLFGLLMLPPICGPITPRSSTMGDAVQLVNAIRNFYVDYGRLPKIAEDGHVETAAQNAQLLRILCGEDHQQNPRGIRYLDRPPLKQGKRSGIAPETGAWIDRWGNFYRIRIATDGHRIPNPYSDDEPRYLEADYIAWSIGKDGIQGRKNHPQTKKRSDDIVSWETR